MGGERSNRDSLKRFNPVNAIEVMSSIHVGDEAIVLTLERMGTSLYALCDNAHAA